MIPVDHSNTEVERWFCPRCEKVLGGDSIWYSSRTFTSVVQCEHCGLRWEHSEDKLLGPQEGWRLVNAHPRLVLMGVI